MKTTALGDHIFRHGQVPSLLTPMVLCTFIWSEDTLHGVYCLFFHQNPFWCSRLDHFEGDRVARWWHGQCQGQKSVQETPIDCSIEEATPYPQTHISGLGEWCFTEKWLLLSHVYWDTSRCHLGKCRREEVWLSLTSSTNRWKIYCWVSLRPWQSSPTPSQPGLPREEIDFISHFTLHLFCLPQRKAPTQWHKRHHFYLLPIYLCLCVPLSRRKANQCGNPADWDCSMKLARWMQAQ